MDRFDSMRSKGINTNDADATAADIASGKTAYVKGKKIYGTASGSGGDISVGTTVTVEARSAIARGERWEGVLNDEFASETIGKQAVNGTFSGYASEDLSIGIKSNALTASNKMTTIYFFDEESSGYVSYSIDLTELASDFTGTSLLPAISDDGKLVAFVQRDLDKVITIEIDRENRTATPYLSTLPHVVNSACPNIFVASANSGTFLLYTGNQEKDGDVITAYAGARVAKYNFRTHSFSKSGMTNESFNWASNAVPQQLVGKCGWANSNTLIAMSSSNYYILKYNFGDTTTITYKRDSSYNISGDCTKAMSTSGMLYAFNPQDLSMTTIGNCFSTSASAILDITGRYAIKGSDIYDVSKVDASTKGTLIGTAAAPSLTKMVNINRFTSGQHIYGFPKGSTAQYLISNLTGNMVAGKYYGVATNNMNLGDTGTAQLLFAT